MTALAMLAVAIACAGDPKPPPPPMIVSPLRRERTVAAAHVDLASLRRLVQHFDFEDPDRFPRELPEHWYRVLSREEGRPGFPDFGEIRLVDDVARTGRWSLAFDCRGGSMAVALPPGVVRIFPGSRYRLSCWVRSAGLEHAGARLVARLHGSNGRPIGVELASEPIAGEERWTQIVLDLDRVPPEAAELALELELVQPRALATEGSRPTGDDIEAMVWFDDLEIWQMPSIRFATGKPGQIFRVGETPEVMIEMRDVVSDQLTAHLRVEDIDGRVLVEDRVGVASGGEPVLLALPELRRPGWYRASLTVEGDGAVIARRTLDLSVIDEERPARSSLPRFGLSLPPLSELDGELAGAPGGELATALIQRLAPSFVLLPLWSEDYRPARSAEAIDALRPLLDRLLDRRIEPMLVIPGLPEALAASRHLDPWQALAFFGSDDPQARDLLEPWLLAFGAHVERWQVGGLETPAARDARQPDHALRVRELLASLVADPTLLLPGEADRGLAELPAGVAHNMLLPWSLRSGGSVEFRDLLAEPGAVVTIEPAPPDDFTPRARIDDLAIRTLDAWRQGAVNLCLRLPLRRGESAGERVDALLPEALAWRRLARALGGRRFVGEIRLGAGARLWIAKSESDVVLLAWSDAGPQSVELTLAAGELRRVDLLGESSMIQRSAGGHRIELDGSPIALEGADPRIAELLASVRLEPETVESRRVPQRVDVVFRNPTAGPLNGTLTIPDHLEWEITPRRLNVVGSTQADVRVPIELTLPRSVTQGEATLAIEFEPSGGNLPRLRLSAPIRVDWPQVRVERSWRFTRSVETGRVDISITVSVTNRSTEPLDLEAFALARNFTQHRRPILRLGPGQTASRTFQFADGARRLSGATVYTGVSELEGDRRLTLELVIPQILPPVSLSATVFEE